MANYIEYNLFASKHPMGSSLWRTDLGQEHFSAVLKRFSSQSGRPMQRDYKETVYGDIFLQNLQNEELKVFRLTPVTSSIEGKRLRVAFQKQKLSLVNVPSTADFDNINYVRQLVFRISNRIFINFQVKKDASTGHTSYSVYVNYNHDAQVDTAVVDRQLERLFKQIEGPIC